LVATTTSGQHQTTILETRFELSPCQVLLALSNLVFAAPGLSWSDPTDSLELFAGECAITRGEHKDRVYKTLMFSSCKLWFLLAPPINAPQTTKGLSFKSFHHPGSI